MARHDVFPNPGGTGLLVDVQSDLLQAMATRVVVPLVPRETAPAPATRLNPVFTIQGAPYVLLTQSLAAVPITLLRQPVETLAGDADTITQALDMLFHGF